MLSRERQAPENDKQIEEGHSRRRAVDGLQVDYWEWFRKDGTKLRSGHFDNGQQTGEWTTYDKRGEVYKVTTIKAKPKKA